MLTAACASPPRSVAPTAVVGSVPAPVPGRNSEANADAEATDGPLVIKQARFEWMTGEPGAYRWSGEVANTWSGTFAVTVVFQVLGDDGITIHHQSLSRLLTGLDTWAFESRGVVAEDRLDRVASWRLEYWVRFPPTPRR